MRNKVRKSILTVTVLITLYELWWLLNQNEEHNVIKLTEISTELKQNTTAQITQPKVIKTKVIIRGERHSGTNWFRALLTKNCPGLQYKLSKFKDIDSKYGWKHAKLNLTIIPQDELFIVLIRDTKSWLPRLRLNTYEKTPENNLPMVDFLNSPWLPDKSVDDHYENVFQMRYEKYRNWLEYSRKFPDNVVLIKYEDVVAGTEKVFRTLEEQYNLRVNAKFIEIDTYSKYGRKNLKPFIESGYEWSAEELKIIEKNINNDFEKSIGYE